MKKIINYFPVLNDELLFEVFPEVKYEFSYIKDNKEIIIKHDESIGQNISLNTKDNDWNHYEYDLKVTIKITVQNGYKLYGEDGIAPKGSKIAMGIEYYSQKSRLRDVVIEGDILDDDDGEYEYTTELILEKNKYLSDVEIHPFIYLIERAKKINDDSLFLNNEEGVLIGTIDSRRLFLVGTGSLFPVFVDAIDSDRLWLFDIDYDNPEIDKFSDCTKLIFNTNHKDYNKLNPKDKSYCERLVLEIISTCLYMSFSKLKEDGYLEEIQASYEDGSIMSLVSYYKDTLNINFTSEKTIFDSLQEFVNKEYKNVV